MMRFIAQLNGALHINVQADKMIKEENMIYAYNGYELVAAVEISAVIAVYLSERGRDNEL